MTKLKIINETWEGGLGAEYFGNPCNLMSTLNKKEITVISSVYIAELSFSLNRKKVIEAGWQIERTSNCTRYINKDMYQYKGEEDHRKQCFTYVTPFFSQLLHEIQKNKKYK